MGYSISYTAMDNKVAFIDLEDEITQTELNEIVEIGAFDRIQCQFVPKKLP